MQNLEFDVTSPSPKAASLLPLLFCNALCVDEGLEERIPSGLHVMSYTDRYCSFAHCHHVIAADVFALFEISTVLLLFFLLLLSTYLLLDALCLETLNP